MTRPVDHLAEARSLALRAAEYVTAEDVPHLAIAHALIAIADRLGPTQPKGAAVADLPSLDPAVAEQYPQGTEIRWGGEDRGWAIKDEDGYWRIHNDESVYIGVYRDVLVEARRVGGSLEVFQRYGRGEW